MYLISSFRASEVSRTVLGEGRGLVVDLVIAKSRETATANAAGEAAVLDRHSPGSSSKPPF